MLPNFLIIGAMKAGTTSLFQYLRTHPEIFMPSVKELDYFNRNWGRGQWWYESNFDSTHEAKAVGEASPNYTKAHMWPETAQRMAAVIPDARLIYVVREPVERIRSMYHHQVAAGAEDRPIEVALRDESDPRTKDYINTSLYAFQLERYMEHFERDQILVVTSDDLLINRLDIVRLIFRFLEVDEEWIPPTLDREAHRSAQKSLVDPIAYRIRRLPGYRRLTMLTPRSLKLAAHRITTQTIQTEISEDLRRHLQERVRPDVKRLAALLKVSAFDGWGMR